MKKIITHAMMSMLCITTSVIFTMDLDKSEASSQSSSPVATQRKGTPFGSPLSSPERSPRSAHRTDTPPAIVYLQHQIKENKKNKTSKISKHHSLIENFEAQTEEKKHTLKSNLQEKTYDIETILDLLQSDDNEQLLHVTATHADGSPVEGTTITPITTPPATPRIIPVHTDLGTPAIDNSHSTSSAGRIEEVIGTIETTKNVIKQAIAEIGTVEKEIETAQKATDIIKDDATNIKAAADTLSSEQKKASSLQIVGGVSVSIIALIALLYHLDHLPANIMHALNTYLPQFLVKGTSSKA